MYFNRRMVKINSFLWYHCNSYSSGIKTRNKVFREKNGAPIWIEALRHLGCSMFQRLGCLPIKAVHELSSECRETVQSIPSVNVRVLKGPFPCTRGPGRTHLWSTNYHVHSKCWVAKCGTDKC